MTGTFAIGVLVLGRVLSLAEAERTAVQHQPQLAQAKAETEAAGARADQALSYLFPELKGAAVYERATYNRVPNGLRPDRDPSSAKTFNNYDFLVEASQLVWDFGYSTNRWSAARELRQAQAQSEIFVRQLVLLDVRQSYFRARAYRALVGVARETLANVRRHQDQIEGFVRVGNRPQIDLVQVKSEVARANVSLIEAENTYAIARAALNRAMGVVGTTDYEVADDSLPTVQGEDLSLQQLVEHAMMVRPDVAALATELKAQQLTIDSLRGAYFPKIFVAGYFKDQGVDITNLRWNFGGLATLVWPVFQGGITRGQVREARAQQSGLVARAEALRQEVVVAVQTAQLAVRAAREEVVAADESLALANERLRMAEGRYGAGVGSVIELGDAQLGQTTAAAQKVQADFKLAAARAQLLQALGAG